MANSERRVEVSALKDKSWLFNVCQVSGVQEYIFHMKKKGDFLYNINSLDSGWLKGRQPPWA